MSENFDKFEESGFAMLELDNAPVNSLSIELRKKIIRFFKSLKVANGLKGVFIIGSGKNFSAGADISELQTGLAEPSLNEVLAEIEACELPVIAAIDGVALGGGLELALACDLRIASQNAKFGLPEVNIGIIPGAGGTQRLPRIIGIENACDMITSGTPISSTRALEIGLIDDLLLVEGDYIEQIFDYLQSYNFEDLPARACNRAAPNAPTDSEFFNHKKEAIIKTSKGRVSSLRAIDALKHSISTSLKEGLAHEARIFFECLNSSEASALIHLFFAERGVAKIDGIDDKIHELPINEIAIIGAGTMGAGIAMNFLSAGVKVSILDANPEALERGVSIIRKNYASSVTRGKMTPEQVEKALSYLNPVTEYSKIANVDMVIEAVFENLEVKKKVFALLEENVKPEAIFATNTSTLDVNEIATACNRPRQVVGLHFFSPANIMRLVEIVRTKDTSPEVLKTVISICRKIKKIGVVVGVCFGFVGNRMLEPYIREANRLLLEGATPEQVDKAMEDFGYNMGPLAMTDLAGVDVGALVREGNKAATCHEETYCVVADGLAQKGNNGQKTGKGFYLYDGRKRLPNHEVLAMATVLSAKYGIKRREISQDEIFERLFFTKIDEGLRILEEGIAERAADIDVIWCNGYGFPTVRGGPMHWAKEFGFAKILERLEHYREELKEYGAMWFQTSELLKKLAVNPALLK